jgi:hypothetical protein
MPEDGREGSMNDGYEEAAHSGQVVRKLAQADRMLGEGKEATDVCGSWGGRADLLPVAQLVRRVEEWPQFSCSSRFRHIEHCAGDQHDLGTVVVN